LSHNLGTYGFKASKTSKISSLERFLEQLFAEAERLQTQIALMSSRLKEQGVSDNKAFLTAKRF
jgi:hypothetical protein